jgi:putative transposase
MRFPLVLDLAADGFPVAVTCRALGFTPQAFYKWHNPVSQRDRDDTHLIDAARDIHDDDPAFGYRFHRRRTRRPRHPRRGEPGAAIVCAAADLVGLRPQARTQQTRGTTRP